MQPRHTSAPPSSATYIISNLWSKSLGSTSARVAVREAPCACTCAGGRSAERERSHERRRLGGGASASGAIGGFGAVGALCDGKRTLNAALEGGADLLRTGVHGSSERAGSGSGSRGGGVLRAVDSEEPRCELEPEPVEDERECEREPGSGRTARGCSPTVSSAGADGEREAVSEAGSEESCTRFRATGAPETAAGGAPPPSAARAASRSPITRLHSSRHCSFSCCSARTRAPHSARKSRMSACTRAPNTSSAASTVVGTAAGAWPAV